MYAHVVQFVYLCSYSGDARIHLSKVKNEVLLPNPHQCALVRKINHAALIHFDNIPDIQQHREELETILGKLRAEIERRKHNNIEMNYDDK